MVKEYNNSKPQEEKNKDVISKIEVKKSIHLFISIYLTLLIERKAPVMVIPEKVWFYPLCLETS